MSYEPPLVCICIPTYNAAGTIRETLKSILAQTHPNLVVHISDNASTDETLEIIESMADSRVRVHRHEKNIGGEGNFTRCIQLATGKYTAIFHADDIYEPEMITMQVDYLEENPEVGATLTEAMTIDEHGVVLGNIGGPPGEKGKTKRYDFSKLIKTVLLHHNIMVCPSAMVRTQIFHEEIKQWRGDMFHSGADLDVWLRIASKHMVVILGEQLMRYRVSRAQFSDSIRSRTERSDFFLVMDHYLAQPEVRKFITANDLRHYRWLERHDQVARAINLFVAGRIPEAKDLLRCLFCRDAIYAAIVTRRGLVTLLGGFLLWLFILFGFRRIGNKLIKFMRKISWK